MFDREGIVPDSQIFPGSSSYRPTASTSEGISSHNQLSTNYSSPRCSPESTDNSLATPHLLEPLGDTVEDTSGVYVAESPENRNWSRRSTSISNQYFSERSRSSSSRSGLLAVFKRSTSDPSLPVDSTQEISSIGLVTNPDIHQHLFSRRGKRNAVANLESDQEDQGIEVPHSSDSYSQVRDVEEADLVLLYLLPIKIISFLLKVMIR